MLNLNLRSQHIPDYIVYIKKIRPIKWCGVLLMGICLLTPGLFVSGAKPGLQKFENSTTSNCLPNKIAQKRLPLNLSKIPAPPVPAKFLGLSSSTFAPAIVEGGGSASHWCWGSHCSHILLACSSGSIRGGPCCFECCNEFGCSDVTCCSPVGGEESQ
jgi:hypothetical protein